MLTADATTIATLRAGDEVDGVFACARKDRLQARSGLPYLALELRDRTGAIQARAFRDADLLAGRFERGDLVRVRGRVERFREELQLYPTNVRARSGLAMLYAATNHPDRVAAVIDEMLAVSPSPAAYARAAQLWDMFGQPARAKAVRADAAARFKR